MPGLPNVPNVVRVDYRYTIGADVNVNSSLHFRFTGAGTDLAGLNALAGSIHTSYQNRLLPQQGSDVYLNEIWVQDLTDMTAPVGIWTGNQAGTSSSGHGGTAALCAVAGYRISRRYRGGHPRGYWPLLAFNDMAGPATWKGTSATAFQTALTNHVADVSALTTPLAMGPQCSISYYLGSTPHTLPSGRVKNVAKLRATPVVDTVTGITVNTRFGSQRRRIKKA